jgi:hypothetical protein
MTAIMLRSLAYHGTYHGTIFKGQLFFTTPDHPAYISS